jgi:hypothetical protein
MFKAQLHSLKSTLLYNLNCLFKGKNFYKAHVPCIFFGEWKYHTFMGYYDICAFNGAEDKMVAARCPSAHNIRAMDKELEIGFYNLETEEFTKIANTQLWSWQQACRLQWVNWQGVESLMYNDLVNGEPNTIIYNPSTMEQSALLPFATYAMNNDCTLAATLDFNYLEYCREGYGYDWNENLPVGLDRAFIEIYDTATFERLTHTKLDDILAVNPHPSMMEDGVGHYFNHLHFNPSGTRLMIFHIWNENRGKRYIRALTMNPDGSDICDVTRGTHISHYWWLSDEQILIYGTDPQNGLGYHVYAQNGGLIRTLNGMPHIDGHPSLNPVESSWLAGDTVQNKCFEREVWIYDLDDELRIDIASFRSPLQYSGANRCDLHPRWSSKGNFIAIDTAHNGYRQIALLDVGDLVKPE